MWLAGRSTLLAAPLAVVLVFVMPVKDSLAQFLPATSAQPSSILVQDYAFSNLEVSTSRNVAMDASRWNATDPEPVSGHKSPMLAAGLSLIVPGLGEYYVGDQYWRGFIFSGLEIGLWVEHFHYIARGDDSTVAFRNFADMHWDPSRYSLYLDSILVKHGFDSLAHGSDLHSINNAERVLDSLSVYGPDLTVKNFTHRLPIEDRQQYYELISKYIQYTAGWDDDVDHTPEHSKHYQEHADMRERMNWQYDVATYFTWGIIANHVLSAIDAALLARDHNSRLRLHGELLQRRHLDGSIGYVPTANIELTF